ncbi:methyltransferase domain-containing protein [Roseovarius salis]|uniref:class I SAM-dependent DNA methyltransferase n=1 Tax=Roseovarius salis TaxID=3376063 RepID=UPI0037C63D47
MDTENLDDVYGAKSADEAREIYNTWSASYDADNLAKGFRLPALGAGLLASFAGRTHGPILDAGCGTGLVGETLMLMGYHHVFGCDLSPEMIAQAERTGAYSGFEQADMGAALPYADDHFAGFVCVGSFGPGHAPPETLRHLARVTRPGGYGVFNLLEASYKEQGFPQVMEDLTANGVWETVHVTPPFRPFLLGEPDLWSRAHVVRML